MGSTTKSDRICIYPKDIQRLTGRTERFGRNLLVKIREHFDKQSHQFVTIREFAEYTGLEQEDVEKIISD
jgi:hypothetical protein